MVTDLTAETARNGFAGCSVYGIIGTVSAPYGHVIFGTVFVVTQGLKIVFEASRHLVKHADTEHCQWIRKPGRGSAGQRISPTGGHNRVKDWLDRFWRYSPFVSEA